MSTTAACGSVPVEQHPPPEGRQLAPQGAIRGTVVYSGPHPCSSSGHIIGAAILFVFDRRNLPPPNGTASSPVNFGVVTGDTLFASEPRTKGSDVYCPVDHGVTDSITASAPFAIGPLDGASYIIEAFYDYIGDFQPSFKFRQLPERGDIAGGALDTVDAIKNGSNPNFQAHFLPVDVGIARPMTAGAPGIHLFDIPSSGFVAENVTVTIGSPLPMTRPYFYAEGEVVDPPFDPTQPSTLSFKAAQSSAERAKSLTGIEGTTEANPDYQPILTIPQDLEVFSAPIMQQTLGTVNNFEARFPHIVLRFGVPDSERTVATSSTDPFHFQIPAQAGGISVWQNALRGPSGAWVPQDILEGPLPQLWPLVALTKLVDDPQHQTDPASLTTQGSATDPVVIIESITLLGNTMGPDNLVETGLAARGGQLFDQSAGTATVFVQDHVTALIRPAVICFDNLFDANATDKRGTLVTPYLLGLTADLPAGVPKQPLVTPAALMNPQVTAIVKKTLTACLPTGRYAINLVYPNGQAWTLPNEAGGCFGNEGQPQGPGKPTLYTNYNALTCYGKDKQRPVLRSQGPRAVVEIIKTKDPTHCVGYQAVPAVCGGH